MLLIGSQALLHHTELDRRPLDIDIIATFDELGALTNALKKGTQVESIPLSSNKTVLRCRDGRIVEVELAWQGTAARKLLDHHTFAPMPHLVATNVGLPLPAFIPSLDELYTLKMSHRYLKNSPHFRKTRDDIMLMRGLGAKVFDADWLRQREEETYVYKHPRLNVMKKDFFTGDGVQYVYDHDDIHITMAHFQQGKTEQEWREWAVGKSQREIAVGPPRIPAYTLYMKDGEEVRSDRRKFFAHDESVRLFGVLEEAQVLALERSQIPFRGKVDPRRSFDIALQKVCTSITSGWFREYAWENFSLVEAMYEPDYVDRFWKAVDEGRVRKL